MGPHTFISSTTDDMDYRGVTTTVIFESNKNRTCFDIQIINDQLDEETELFSVEILSVPSDSGVVISTPALATVSIIDDDGKNCCFKLVKVESHICGTHMHFPFICSDILHPSYYTQVVCIDLTLHEAVSLVYIVDCNSPSCSHNQLWLTYLHHT